MFRGNIPATVDEKGRLKIPTDFKDALDKEYGQDLEFFVTSLEGKSVWVYPLPEWKKKEEKLAPVPGEKEANKARNHYSGRANYWGQTTRADAQGRVLIPALLREAAGMKGEVAVMGQGMFLEVWSHEPLRESMTLPFPEEDRDTLYGLGV